MDEKTKDQALKANETKDAKEQATKPTAVEKPAKTVDQVASLLDEENHGNPPLYTEDDLQRMNPDSRKAAFSKIAADGDLPHFMGIETAYSVPIRDELKSLKPDPQFRFRVSAKGQEVAKKLGKKRGNVPCLEIQLPTGTGKKLVGAPLDQEFQVGAREAIYLYRKYVAPDKLKTQMDAHGLLEYAGRVRIEKGGLLGS